MLSTATADLAICRLLTNVAYDRVYSERVAIFWHQSLQLGDIAVTTEVNLSGEPPTSQPLPQVATDAWQTAVADQFQWTKQWYPIAVVEFLDPSRPHALQLLGKNLVVWRDSSQQWHCFEDACPHRLAPLSEGRVEPDGTLLCAYHAWRFNAQGQCVRIPQSQDAQTEARHCANPKSCARVYPTQERQGLLWVWAESGQQALQESRTRSPRLIPELAEPSDRVVKLFWNIRDLPYGWDSFMENVADPAHVPVSHHGIMGSRYQDPRYFDLVRIGDLSTQDGVAYVTTPTPPAIAAAIHDFKPPCLMRITTTYTDEGKLILVLYATPTRPGWCRHIGCQVLIKNQAGKVPPGLAFFTLPMPAWLGHILASLFLHQDMVFLHYQEKILAQRQPDHWIDAVFTPNPQDKMVITFRQWLKHRAGGGIPWAGCPPELPPAEMDKQRLFDVWTTHTQHCHSCQTALKAIRRWQVIAYGAAIGCFMLGIMLDARAIAMRSPLMPENASRLATAPPAGFWWAIGAAIFCVSIGYGLKRLIRLFYVYEFEHARND
ncbi:Rieske 2Fe-2S domain-containing protein [Pantanalinema rosaneae CENA516]|uniref:aromatic ring-hydroxylating dioxygenase subunit alpha n=1 Tax=Pantanalinema rosaneae TaxID=1620701 RepID=UPI003D6DFD3C